jgi:hypothetical protein
MKPMGAGFTGSLNSSSMISFQKIILWKNSRV